MSEAGERVSVVVSVDDDHLDSVAEVAERLRGAGMQVEEAMDSIGMVTGSVAPSRVPALAAVEGVGEVEPERQYQLPPPESDLQ